MRNLLIEKKQGKSEQQPGNSSTISREQLKSAAHRYDKKFQDLMEEFKTLHGYKVNEDSDQIKKLRSSTNRLITFKKKFSRKKLLPYQANFVEEHLKEARLRKASSDNHWLAHVSKGTQPAMNAEQSSRTQAVNDSNNNYPTQNPVSQTLINGATSSHQELENISKTSSAKQRREERMKKFHNEIETEMRLEQAQFERRKLKLEMQVKDLETKHHQLEQERELERKVKRTTIENDDVRSRSTSA